MEVNRALFIFIAILTRCRTSYGYSDQYTSNIGKFLNNMIQQKFPSCELIFVHDGHMNAMKTTHSVLSDLKFSSEKGTYLINIWDRYISDRFGDIPRFSEFCSIAVIIIEEMKENLSDNLFLTLTRLYGPMIRKDEDYFFFISPVEVIRDVMLARDFGAKIKFKIALVEDSKEDFSFKFETVCFYCLPTGLPEVLQLNLPTIKKKFVTGEVVREDTGIRLFSALNALNRDPDIERLFPDMVRNLNGRAIRMTNPTCLWRFEIEWRNGRYHPKRGSYKWWLDEAMEKFNFTYDVFYSFGDRGTGQKLNNGTWFGTVSDIMHDRADLGFATGRTTHRNRHVGFSFPLSYEWLIFSTAKPKVSFSWKAIFWPFTPVMWLSSFICVVIIGFTFIKLAKSTGSATSASQWSLPRTAEYIIATFLEQDRVGPNNLPYTPIRTFCAFWLLFSFIMATAYRAKLVSVIAFPLSEWIPTTFDELAASQEFGAGLHYLGGAAYSTFKSSSNPVYVDLYHKFELFPDDAECHVKTTKQKFSCIAYDGVADYVNAKNMSDKHGRSPLVKSDSTTFFLTVGLIMPVRAIFHLNFDKTIWNSVESGLTVRWIKLDEKYVRKLRWEYEASINKTKYVIQEEGSAEFLGLKHFVGAFMLLIIGLISCTILFIYENVKGRDMKELNSKVTDKLHPAKKKFQKIKRVMVTSNPTIKVRY